jgi:hypothetical protein
MNAQCGAWELAPDFDPDEVETDDEPRLTLDEVKQGRTDDIAAERAGFGGKDTYRKAKQVITNGSSELIDAMDAGRWKPTP